MDLGSDEMTVVDREVVFWPERVFAFGLLFEDPAVLDAEPFIFGVEVSGPCDVSLERDDSVELSRVVDVGCVFDGNELFEEEPGRDGPGLAIGTLLSRTASVEVAEVGICSKDHAVGLIMK